tara:strand:- start:724 stop:1287 length:564 start_codon:yes stop_codon:yes gene_type:complete
MFAGKTTETLKRILWAKNGRGQSIRVFKPAFDQRYARLQIVSHEGLAADAEAVVDWDQRSQTMIEESIDVVFFDEVQFFESPNFRGDILQIVEDLLAAGIDVVCSGLDMDWQGKPFPIIAHMAAKADEVHKLRGVCTVCGRPSTKTYKKTGSGGQIEIGGAELYESRCTIHWAVPDLELTPDLFYGR